MASAAVRVRKFAILTHRWLGVGFCVLFVVWFASGVAMMYWDYPRVDPAERLKRSETIAGNAVRLSPAEAFEASGHRDPPDLVRLTMLNGRPVYRFQHGIQQRVVYADTGDSLQPLGNDEALAVASRWTGLAGAQAVFEGHMTQEDQWTLNSAVRPLRPFSKFSWPNGEEVYVSEVTGEVIQYTTRQARIGAYVGAIPHWLYFTVLRKETGLWRQVVIWLSAAGTAMTIFGLVAGLWLYSPAKRYRFANQPSSVPYAGQKRWHTIFGLVFGAVTFTWILSGMMSMNPFQWESSGAIASRKLRGGNMKLEVLGPLAIPGGVTGVKEVAFSMFGGEPVVRLLRGNGPSLLLQSGATRPEFSLTEMRDAAERAFGAENIAEVRWLTEYETYYVDRHGRKPLPAVFVQLSGSGGETYYLDPRTGALVQSYNGQSRWNRWLYHGLHSFDLPALYRNRPAWDLLVLTLMAGGTALSVTGTVIGARRLRRKLQGTAAVGFRN